MSDSATFRTWRDSHVPVGSLTKCVIVPSVRPLGDKGFVDHTVRVEILFDV